MSSTPTASRTFRLRMLRKAALAFMARSGPGPATDPLSTEEEAFLRAGSRALTVPRALDADLVSGQGMSLSEYTALMHLSEAPGRTLRMSDLASACALSLSGMSRIVDRLDAQGMVERQRSTCDRRDLNAVLTDAGLDSHDRPCLIVEPRGEEVLRSEAYDPERRIIQFLREHAAPVRSLVNVLGRHERRDALDHFGEPVSKGYCDLAACFPNQLMNTFIGDGSS